jgi:membrane-associated phospholipid phosphatase
MSPDDLRARQRPSRGFWDALARATPWWLVAALAAAMLAGLAGWDRPTAEAIRAHIADQPVAAAAPALTWRAAARMVSRCGESWVYVLIAAAVLLAAWRVATARRRLLRIGLGWLLALALGGIVARIIKIACGRWRPSHLAEGQFGFTFFSFNHKLNSFPSGHACDAMVAAVVNWCAWPKLRPLAAAWFVLIAAARLVALDHFPSDLAAGALIGLFSALFARSWLARANTRGQ